MACSQTTQHLVSEDGRWHHISQLQSSPVMTTQRLVDLTVSGIWCHKSQLQSDHDHSAPCRSNWFQGWLLTSQAPAAGLTIKGFTDRTALTTFRCRLSADVTVSNSSRILVLLRHRSICSNRTGTEGLVLTIITTQLLIRLWGTFPSSPFAFAGALSHGHCVDSRLANVKWSRVFFHT